jgi:hypothetical protein
MGIGSTKALTKVCMEVFREEAGTREVIENVENGGILQNVFNASINPLLLKGLLCVSAF